MQSNDDNDAMHTYEEGNTQIKKVFETDTNVST